MNGEEMVHIYVSGEVQGVGFRYWTYRAANEAGVSGWVRNLPDGRVEAVFEGSAESVESVVEWCRKGPSSAVVTKVQLDERTSIERDFDGFEVR